MSGMPSRFEHSYARLRALAGKYHFEMGIPSSTLQPTAVVHEAYLRIVEYEASEIKNDEHFLAVIATAMRQIIVDHARQRRTLKRGGDLRRVAFEDASQQRCTNHNDPLVVDEMLTRLEQLDPRQARIVELRVFGGLSIAEIAQALDVSESTVEKSWRQARAWMRLELQHTQAN